MSMGSRVLAASPPRVRASGLAGADRPEFDCTCWLLLQSVEHSVKKPSRGCYDRMIPMNALLALEDGSWYRGVAAGAQGEARGEVVFNTSMTGYQEVLTDPSYAGQIVTMTAPQIGNYGVASGDAESQVPHVAGFVMREASPVASNWRADGTLRDYLVRHNIVAIADIDTRALTRVLRSAGVMRGVIATGHVDPAELVEKARSIPRMEGADLVKDVTCEAPFAWRDRAEQWGAADHREFGIAPQGRAR